MHSHAETQLIVEVSVGAHSSTGQIVGKEMRKVTAASINSGLRQRFDEQLMFHVPQVNFPLVSCVCAALNKPIFV